MHMKNPSLFLIVFMMFFSSFLFVLFFSEGNSELSQLPCVFLPLGGNSIIVFALASIRFPHSPPLTAQSRGLHGLTDSGTANILTYM